MIIDAHNHPDWHKHDLKRFLENMRRYHIDVTWLLSWECPEDEYEPSSALPPVETGRPIPLARCVSYAERAPGKFVLGYAPDPRKPGAIDRLQAAMEICGVRICGELKLRMMLDNFDAIRMFRFCGSKGLPVIVHLDYPIENGQSFPRPDWWYGGGIEALERALRACPDTIFLGHAPGFWAHISNDGRHLTEVYPKGKVAPGGKLARMLRAYPNLYCDLSAGSAHIALSRDLKFSRDFVLEFQDRILYARDCFDNAHQELLGSMKLPPKTLAKLYSGNALKLVPLSSNAKRNRKKIPAH